MCENTSFEKCMKCGKYSVNERHGHRNKPTEEVIICPVGGIKRWDYVNHEYQYKEDDFCEWKHMTLTEGMFQSHGEHESLTNVESWNFCPYCGKKIKIIY